MNAIKKAAVASKNFIVNHRTAILATVAAAAISGVVIERKALNEHDEFLKENGLYDQFYAEPETIEIEQ